MAKKFTPVQAFFRKHGLYVGNSREKSIEKYGFNAFKKGFEEMLESEPFEKMVNDASKLDKKVSEIEARMKELQDELDTLGEQLEDIEDEGFVCENVGAVMAKFPWVNEPTLDGCYDSPEELIAELMYEKIEADAKSLSHEDAVLRLKELQEEILKIQKVLGK